MAQLAQFLSMAIFEQDSVATCLRCGGVFNNDFITNLLLNPPVNEF